VGNESQHALAAIRVSMKSWLGFLMESAGVPTSTAQGGQPTMNENVRTIEVRENRPQKNAGIVAWEKISVVVGAS